MNYSKYTITKKREMNSWGSMRQRCFNKKHQQYSDYGGRGIKPCIGLDTFRKFYECLGVRPKDNSLDRINNNYGYWCGNCEECISNSQPINVKWSSRLEQNSNKRKYKCNKTGYTGVYRYYDKYQATKRINGKLKYFGTYLTAIEAYKALKEGLINEH